MTIKPDDARGNICEHLVESNVDRTLCGLPLRAGNTQTPCGNAECKSCQRVARGRLWHTGGAT